MENTIYKMYLVYNHNHVILLLYTISFNDKHKQLGGGGIAIICIMDIECIIGNWLEQLLKADHYCVVNKGDQVES